MRMPETKSVAQFVIDDLDIQRCSAWPSSAVDPTVRRGPAHIGRPSEGASKILGKSVHVPVVVREIYTCFCGRILCLGGNLTNVTGRDADWDRVPANNSAGKRCLLVRVFCEEIVGRAKKHILRIRYRVGLNGIVLKVDENN
jgi:hypothetical protein